MAVLTKIDSNVTGLRYCEEDSYKTVSGDETWQPLEPNSYNDFGGEVTTVARNPINPSRQRKKGVVTDLDASGGFVTDVTQTNLQDLLQGFMFADLRRKEEYGGASDITAVAASDDSYAGTGIEDDLAVGDLVFASGFTNAANNGLKTVATVTGPDKITVSEALVDETPPADAKLVHVGHVFAADDLNIDVSGSRPTITSDASFDFSAFGLVPGEWIYIGGDDAGTDFSNAENNGFARVFLADADGIVLDKTESTMVAESLSGGETIQIFFGRVLKNETGSLIKRRTYQLERSLGAPDDSAPSEIQAEYIVGCVPSEFELSIPTANKAEATLTFVGADHETIDGPTSLKAGTRPDLVEADAFNTSSDVPRIKLAVYDAADSAPTALFAFVTELTLSINNNVTPNKAIGVLGAFEVTVGTFEVSGSMTAYFSDVAAVAAVRNNSDVTMDMHMVKDNAGLTVDVPLITLGDGRLNVEQDQPITLPLSTDAATGAKIDSSLDHTLLLVFWDYLPDIAG